MRKRCWGRDLRISLHEVRPFLADRRRIGLLVRWSGVWKCQRLDIAVHYSTVVTASMFARFVSVRFDIKG